MFAPDKGNTPNLRTLRFLFPNVLNLSQNILKRDKKTESTKFVSLKVYKRILVLPIPIPLVLTQAAAAIERSIYPISSDIKEFSLCAGGSR